MASIPSLFEELQTKEQQLEAIREIVLSCKNVEPQLIEGQGYFKAMTLKIDKQRYTILKQMGLDSDKTSQQLLIEAVDLLLAQNKKQS